MAGQAQRGQRDHGQTSRRGARVVVATGVSTGGAGSDRTILAPSPGPALPPAKAPTPTPRAIWRLLQLKGLTPDEAASLTAFLYGLPSSDLHWTLPQLNQFLFLQRMDQIGRFGADDGARKPTA